MPGLARDARRRSGRLPGAAVPCTLSGTGCALVCGVRHAGALPGLASVPPPTAVMTNESLRLSMIVLTKAMRKKRKDMGMNLRFKASADGL